MVVKSVVLALSLSLLGDSAPVPDEPLSRLQLERVMKRIALHAFVAGYRCAETKLPLENCAEIFDDELRRK